MDLDLNMGGACGCDEKEKTASEKKIDNLRESYYDVLRSSFRKHLDSCIDEAIDFHASKDAKIGANIDGVVDQISDMLRMKVYEEMGIDPVETMAIMAIGPSEEDDFDNVEEPEQLGLDVDEPDEGLDDGGDIVVS